LGAAQRAALCWFDALSLLLNKERAKENQPKGPMPFGYPQREKSFRYRFTHFFAKRCIFSLCVCKLKKLANTEVARKQDRKSFLLSVTPPGLTKFQTKTILLPLPAARGGQAARDAE
jgi:hypothetical protein